MITKSPAQVTPNYKMRPANTRCRNTQADLTIIIGI